MSDVDPELWRLAVDGGEPAVVEGPPNWPNADPTIERALLEVVRSGSWGRYEGPSSVGLQQIMRHALGQEYVNLCCSGTFAVELALRGVRVEPGDEVILAAYDFPGNFRAITSLGAVPVLVDVVADGVTLDPEQLETARGPRTRAVIASHLHGQLAELERIVPWAARYGIAVVEDACQAPGASIQGRPVGSWGDAAALSFGGSKLLTAGRGGAVISNRAEVHQRIKIYCEQGNHAFPLSELQATVLIPQWQQLAERHAQRRRAVETLRAGLAPLAGLTLICDPIAEHDPAYYKLALRYDPQLFSRRSRESLIGAIEAEGVAMGAGFRGFAHRSSGRCRKVGELPHARQAAERLLLLHHPVLLESAQTLDRVVQAIAKVAHASR